MEFYLELLFTAVLSVLLAFLLGKIFSVVDGDGDVDGYAAAEREHEPTKIAGERQGNDFLRPDHIDARDRSRSDPAKKCEEEEGLGVGEVRSDEISAEKMTAKVEIEERSIGVETCDVSEIRVEGLGNIFEVSAVAADEDDSVRELPECLVEATEVNFCLGREEVDSGGIETRFERNEAMVGSPFVEEEDGLENRFEASMVEDNSVREMPKLNESGSLEEEKELQFEVMAEDNSVTEMPRLNEIESLEKVKELQSDSTAKDTSMREMPRPKESQSLEDAKELQFGVEKELDAAKSETEVKVEKVDAFLVEEEEECGDNVAGPRGEEETVLKEGSEGEKRGNDKKGQSLLSEEDEWEGIERTELQKWFHEAAAYVGGEGGEFALSSLSDDEQMQLYGLHKVATEGPCYNPQPMVLKVSARAKWHAWQRLGSMNPDAAMEQYMSLLSEKVPGWMGEKAKGDVEKHEENEVTDVALSGTCTPDLCSNIHSKLSAESEGTQELPSCINEESGSATAEHSGQGFTRTE